MSRLTPGERNIAMVFEDYALYPNMSVYENIAFPLEVREYRRSAVRARVEPVLELLGLEAIRDANVRQLSGGAQQRVSIGRALVREPELIVLDEPLSHLDGDQKVQLRAEIKRLQKQTGLTAILVTHDQTEAIAMADRIAVMHEGELQQAGAPGALYRRPANLFVANFIGEPPMNLIRGSLIREGDDLTFTNSRLSLTLSAATRRRFDAGSEATDETTRAGACRAAVLATLLVSLGTMSGAAMAWSYKEAAAPYKGTKITVLDEVTPLQQAFKKLVPQFTAETGIEVNYQLLNHFEVISKGQADLLSGRGAYDSVMLHSSQMGLLLDAEVLRPIDDLLASAKLTSPAIDLPDLIEPG